MVSEEREREGNTPKREQQGSGPLDIPEVKAAVVFIQLVSMFYYLEPNTGRMSDTRRPGGTGTSRGNRT